MKLNSKRTFYVGLAFMSISAFWQVYDGIIPLILKYTFGIGDTWSGAVMALDNVLALFMLPLFGAISDKHHSKWGRRTPFILIGTAAAVILGQVKFFKLRCSREPAFLIETQTANDLVGYSSGK